jgi:hypothetical protein
MIFVHSRKDTIKTCEKMLEDTSTDGNMGVFYCSEDPSIVLRKVRYKSRGIES